MTRTTFASAVVGAATLGLLGCGDHTTEPAPVVAEPPTSSSAQPEPQTRTLALEGVRIEIPASYVAMPQEEIDRQKRTVAAQDPRVRFESTGADAPSGRHTGTVNIMRVEGPTRDRPSAGTVRQALALEAEDMKRQMSLPPVEIVSFDIKEKDHTLEACGTTRLVAGGASVETRVCARSWITRDHEGVLVTGVCAVDTNSAASPCAPILATLELEPGERLPLDTMLPPTTTAPPSAVPSATSSATP